MDGTDLVKDVSAIDARALTGIVAVAPLALRVIEQEKRRRA